MTEEIHTHETTIPVVETTTPAVTTPVVQTTTPVLRETQSNDLVGFAAIKYTAIVVIVLAILAFLALYVLPHLGG